MAIVKSIGFRESRSDDGSSSLPSGGRGTVSDSDGDDDDDARTQSTSAGSDGSDVSDVDSGMESDDYDYSEMAEAGSEFCQVENQTFMVPFELYDLPDLTSILSVDTWNNCLTEDERFALTEYLPDMDQENFLRTLKELFSGENFHFGSPMTELLNRLKGGLCEPRVVLYRRGLNFLQKREHYYHLCKYHNSMVGNLVQIRDGWQRYAGYGLEEKLRLLSMIRSQRHIRYEEDGDAGSATDPDNEEEAHLYNKKGLKMGNRDSYSSKLPLDRLSRQSGALLEPTKFEKENAKGVLKVASSKFSYKKGYIESSGRVYPSVGHAFVPSGQERSSGSEGKFKKLDRYYDGDGDDFEFKEHEYDITAPRAGRSENRKRQEILKRGDSISPSGVDNDDLPDYHRYHVPNGKRNAKQTVTVASYDSHTFHRSKHVERERNDSAKGKTLHMPKESWIDHYASVENYPRRGNAPKEISSAEYPVKLSGMNSKNKKWDNKKDVIKFKSQRSLLLPRDSDYVSKDHMERIRRLSSNNYETSMDHPNAYFPYRQNEETESDSSENFEEEMENRRNLNADLEKDRQLVGKSLYDPKKAKKFMKRNDYAQTFDEGLLTGVQETDSYLPPKHRHRSKTGADNYSHDSSSVKLVDGQKQPYKMLKEIQGITGSQLQLHSQKLCPVERKKKKLDGDPLSSQRKAQDNAGDTFLEDNDGNPDLIDYSDRVNATGIHSAERDNHGQLNMPLSGCKSVTKKRKGKIDAMIVDGIDEAEFQQVSQNNIEDTIPLKKKAKRKSELGTGSLPAVVLDPTIPEIDIKEVEMEIRPVRKPFTLITPTVHTGFSFSIVHLLSAVRKAMITVNVEDLNDISNQKKENNGLSAPHSHDNFEADASSEQKNLPSLTVQVIVNCVRSNPGDPCILETQEPLQDLVRGVLKIFSSKTAPLGAKGWKALAAYEKSTKSWCWVGPVSPSSSDPVEEETSAEAWDIPHKMLVKLVDAFANWLKSGQETLKQIGSLPPPPMMVAFNSDDKERFRDLRAQKSLSTISPSSDEMRVYFRKEEFLRYQIPDRAFSYTAVDGKKSIVAPLRRGGGKPTSKARDHFMLKYDRPPHVTILCLVRDAAARLPGSIGTRADVCTLIRDSQYIVEDVSDAQVNQVVSGALDRLHYERDPCVLYVSERKLWAYLHRDREEEDFEDDGTSSTKKWKKPKKDATENPDLSVADANDSGNGEQAAAGSSGYDFNTDSNIDLSSAHAGEKPDLLYNDMTSNMESIEPLIDSAQGGTHQGHTMGWAVLGMDHSQENGLLCLENSTNEDFDEKTFIQEPVGLLSPSLQ